ncbi:MAG: cupredoxin domain-containing protein [Myxococcota bacterium]
MAAVRNLRAWAVVALLALGCGDDFSEEEAPDLASPPGARAVELTIRDGAFSPAMIEAPSGEWLLVLLRNESEQLHGFAVELPNRQLTLADGISPGGVDHLGFQAPDAAGEHVFYCPVADHRQRGEEGRLVVMPR